MTTSGAVTNSTLVELILRNTPILRAPCQKTLDRCRLERVSSLEEPIRCSPRHMQVVVVSRSGRLDVANGTAGISVTNGSPKPLKQLALAYDVSLIGSSTTNKATPTTITQAAYPPQQEGKHHSSVDFSPNRTTNILVTTTTQTFPSLLIESYTQPYY